MILITNGQIFFSTKMKEIENCCCFHFNSIHFFSHSKKIFIKFDSWKWCGLVVIVVTHTHKHIYTRVVVVVVVFYIDNTHTQDKTNEMAPNSLEIERKKKFFFLEHVPFRFGCCFCLFVFFSM